MKKARLLLVGAFIVLLIILFFRKSRTEGFETCEQILINRKYYLPLITKCNWTFNNDSFCTMVRSADKLLGDLYLKNGCSIWNAGICKTTISNLNIAVNTWNNNKTLQNSYTKKNISDNYDKYNSTCGNYKDSNAENILKAASRIIGR